MSRAFRDFISVPEETGTVMVIEKEFGPKGAKDWAEMAKGIVQIVKCTFGTGALYDEDILRKKNRAYRAYGISPMIGGTLTEVTILEAGGYSQSDLKVYLKYAKSLGFTYLEFSDGTIYIPDEHRKDIIKMCIDSGFTVISEVGKKDPKKDASISIQKRIELMNSDLKSGAQMVIIESRESGKGIGVMGKGGEVDFTELNKIIEAVGLGNTMIEAPEKSQQQTIFMEYGPKVSIGNVQPRDVLSVAALRSGLRGDTISALREEQWRKYNISVKAPNEYN